MMQPLHYACQRASAASGADGVLDAAAWETAARTSRFADAATGTLAFFDTQAALLWDDEALHIGFWLEEHDVWSTGAPRHGLTWHENTTEVLLAGDGALYQLSINAAARTEELLFVWKEAYERGGRYDAPDLDLATQRPMVVGGDSGPHHPRGMRWLFDAWHLAGLRVAVDVDGTPGERQRIDRGWSVRLALPWAGLTHLLDEPGLPQEGAQLRLALARNQVVDQRRSQHTAVWSWHVAGDHGLHAPETYPVIELTARS